MKTRLLQIFALMGILILLSFQTRANAGLTKDTYCYVLAPNGLNLRQAANSSSKKIIKLPYGAKVKYIGGVNSKMIVVDNIRGGMAKVNYQGKTGYVFEGYLSRFAAPKKNTNVKKYAELLRKSGIEIMNEEVRRDWGGYQQIEEAIVLGTARWEEAFIVAKQLFAIPEKLNFPERSGQAKTIVKNPDKKKHVWTDQMEIKRSGGKLVSIIYSSRQEGGGRHISIQKSTDANAKGMRLSVLYIVD